VILAIITVLDQATRSRTGLRLVLDLITPAHGMLFAIAAACGLHHARALAALLAVAVLLCAQPQELSVFARLLVPVGIGLVSGNALRAVIRQMGGVHGEPYEPR
jgi:hypothetical protein